MYGISNFLGSEGKKLFYITGYIFVKCTGLVWKPDYLGTFDICQEIATNGPVEKYVIRHKEALESALAKACVKRKVKSVEDLLPNKTTGIPLL